MSEEKKVRKDIIVHLIAALRSGNYKQQQGGLRDGTGKKATYCCLGVLTDRFIKSKKKKWFKSNSGEYGLYDRLENGDKGSFESCSLPSEVIDWSGLPYADPMLEIPPALQKKANGQSQQTAIHLNDTLAFTFNEIADCFEYTFLRDKNAENKEV